MITRWQFTLGQRPGLDLQLNAIDLGASQAVECLLVELRQENAGVLVEQRDVTNLLTLDTSAVCRSW